MTVIFRHIGTECEAWVARGLRFTGPGWVPGYAALQAPGFPH
ncbi:Uncharacterised protein [Mycobacterium tuberculosis]|nr:hypothetical protein BCGT_1284 [Mycobacterium tuberculosis variant bovis BCG str. ATCC 35743]EQM19283.1 hypothetical protein GuangZ0019_2682 [Mycobacterium tuberculosis GuangZ0019]KAF3408520.1 hypothetical protein BIT17_2022 [Mycobacterium tuberculosis variant bovis]KRT47518.1 hypothetical protein HX90_0628 [Mycobacterium tuberculosis]BAL65409.1 hypothetical protein ERDMAN_1613 [Mycobacterium tuberculosis str. Erdman = ATCC 35801]